MAEKMPKWTFVDGEVRLSDLAIAAGLWALDGAAWAGEGRWAYPGPDKTAWDKLIASTPGLKLLRVGLTGSHVEAIEKRLLSDWVDKSPEGQGKHYRAGEFAPMPQCVFHLRCGYSWRVGDGGMTSRGWTEAEAREWLLRWHAGGNAFLVIPAVFDDKINKLRNVMRDKHGMALHRTMPAPTER